MVREVTMFTQVATFQGKSEKLEDVITQYRDEILPRVEKKAGTKGGLSVMVDHNSGRLLGILFWEKNKNVSDAHITPLPGHAEERTVPPVVNIYEVSFP
jgi:hypothetical protein